MLRVYHGLTTEPWKVTENIEHNAWIRLVQPSATDLTEVSRATGVPKTLLEAALDPKAMPRVEKRGSTTLIILHVPVDTEKNVYDDVRFQTVPLGIVHAKDHLITLETKPLDMIFKSFLQPLAATFGTHMKTRITLLLVKRIAELYEDALNQVDTYIQTIEKTLRQSQKNHEVYALLNLEKTTVTYATSLRLMLTVMRKILTGNYIKLYEDDEILLKESLMELEQAQDTANLFSLNLANILDAYANIVQNNLNLILKYLTFFALLVAVPTTIASIYGMNVPLPIQEWHHAFSFLMGLSVVLSLALVYYFKRKNII